jgi:hypothetical protein
MFQVGNPPPKEESKSAPIEKSDNPTHPGMYMQASHL